MVGRDTHPYHGLNPDATYAESASHRIASRSIASRSIASGCEGEEKITHGAVVRTRSCQISEGDGAEVNARFRSGQSIERSEVLSRKPTIIVTGFAKRLLRARPGEIHGRRAETTPLYRPRRAGQTGADIWPVAGVNRARLSRAAVLIQLGLPFRTHQALSTRHRGTTASSSLAVQPDEEEEEEDVLRLRSDETGPQILRPGRDQWQSGQSSGSASPPKLSSRGTTAGAGRCVMGAALIWRWIPPDLVAALIRPSSPRCSPSCSIAISRRVADADLATPGAHLHGQIDRGLASLWTTFWTTVPDRTLARRPYRLPHAYSMARALHGPAHRAGDAAAACPQACRCPYYHPWPPPPVRFLPRPFALPSSLAIYRDFLLSYLNLCRPALAFLTQPSGISSPIWPLSASAWLIFATSTSSGLSFVLKLEIRSRLSDSSYPPFDLDRSHPRPCLLSGLCPRLNRAYIAASRRSDRSLEARVESARRASEIHKKRTGRSLRVTEQDVINEEMYEEEDDDLPYQYRRLNSHLMTNDSYLDRRLHSYLVNQVAMRTMVGQAVQKAWNENSMYPQAMQSAMMGPGFQSPMGPPQSRANTNNQYRQSPYPTNQVSHGRSASISSPQELHFSHSTQASPPGDKSTTDRRMSASAQTLAPRTPNSQTASSPVLSRHDSSSSLSAQQARLPRENYTPQSQQPFFAGSNFNTDANSTNPLTTSLPMDAQQLLAGAPLDWNDPMMQMLMQNQSGMSSPIYSYNPNGKSKNDNSKTGLGLAQTLAPASLDTSGTSTVSPFSGDTPYAGFDMNFDNSFGNFDLFQSQPNSSGQLTPGEGEFDSFINDGMWGEQSLV
nr:hypothetical protein CFP56_38743 [Quercus suber]